MSKDIDTALGLVLKLPNVLRKTKSGSLIEYTKPTRVEPIVLMEDKLSTVPFMPDVMQSLTSIFSGYYLQAVSLMVNVGSVDVVGLLDSVNPDRDPFTAAEAGAGKMLSMESYKYGLPKLDGNDTPSMEAAVTNSKENMATIKAPSTLAVGKILEVNVSSDGQNATFPVSVRMIPVSATSSSLVSTLGGVMQDTSFMARIHAWRSGRIEFVKDLVLAQDLIEAHRKSLINDSTGIYKQAMKRKNKGVLSSILSLNPSVGTASNIVVLTSKTAKELEKNIGGKLNRFKTREKLMKDTYMMLLVVIDPDWEGITIYHRSIETPSELTAGDVKQMAKKDVDVGEILKAYQLGNSPSF